MAKIRERGEEENTLILFASDNGCSAETVTKGYSVPGEGAIGSMTRWSSLGRDWANACNVPFRYYKNYSYEGGICTPLIAYWPKGIEGKGRVSGHTGHFIDIMPTLLDVSGSDYPSELQGKTIHPYEGESLLPVLQGNTAPRSKPLFWQWSKGKAVRMGKWKLVSHKDQWELFDMETDKTETHNRIDQNPEIAASLKRLYKQWWKRVKG